jgi:hypothetical protein
MWRRHIKIISYLWWMRTPPMIFLLAVLLAACNSNYQKPTDPTEAGRDFINATLKADYSVADKYIPSDTLNEHFFKRYKEWYGNLPDSQKEGYSQASLTIYSVNKPTDSTAIINFSNTYMNRHDNIAMVKKDGEWWVDFGYMFRDTSSNAADTSKIGTVK